VVAPDFGALVAKMQRLQGAFRAGHSRVRTHGESIAFFGGDACEAQTIQTRFTAMMAHAHHVSHVQWGYGVVDDFVVKQLPHIVTWLLSYLYTLRDGNQRDEHKDGGARLGHDLRFVASAVSHTFIAFGDLLQLYKRFMEISGYARRVLEVDQAVHAASVSAGSRARDGSIVVC
jgi:ABC-type uncharacterized transport system fused permease/ATPase subunit